MLPPTTIALYYKVVQRRNGLEAATLYYKVFVMEEIWKDISGYEWSYQVSNLGRVRSLKRQKTKIMSVLLRPDWYTSIWFRMRGINKRSRYPHRLVAQAFISNPENKPCVNHKNGNKQDNRVENLEWSTYGENELHSYRTLWKKHQCLWKIWSLNKLSTAIIQKDMLWNTIRVWWSMGEASKSLWYNTWWICWCCKWNKKYAYWYIREYFIW